MFTEDQLLPISALQHLIFCERQCALIHVERLWAENRWTVEGNHLHAKAHGEKGDLGKTRIENGIRVARGLWLRSMQYGLVGQADVVEFHDVENVTGRTAGDSLPQNVIPVEYKRGKPKKDDSDRVQICAQALCLEEMLDTNIEMGYLFYGKRKRRTKVTLDDTLRERTLAAASRFREIIDNRETPTAAREPKCEACSLVHWCLPDSMQWKRGASQYVERQLKDVLASDGPETDNDTTIAEGN